MYGLTLELGRVTFSKSKLHTRNFLFLHQFSATSQPFKVISLGTLNLKLAIVSLTWSAVVIVLIAPFHVAAIECCGKRFSSLWKCSMEFSTPAIFFWNVCTSSGHAVTRRQAYMILLEP